MLLDRYRQLLTAYVDGELSARQRRHVTRLLRHSAEARQLLQRLQEDARSLRHLPAPRLPGDLTSNVLRTIAERRLSPGSRRHVPVSAPVSWAGPLASWAAAAAVLFVLGVASYLYFAASLTDSEKRELAQESPEKPHKPNPPEPSNAPTIARPDSVSKDERTPTKARPAPATPIKPPEVVQRPDETPKPPPTPKEDSALTTPVDMFGYSKVEGIHLSVIETKQLEAEAGRHKLLDELRKDTKFRIEMPCKNGSKAFERVRLAAAALNLGFVIEKQAQLRLKHPQWKTNYVIYLENITPEDLTKFAQRIGAEDRKAARKPAEAQFDSLVLTRMTANHHKELSTLMGVDPTAMEPAERGPLGTDPRKPLAELTAQQVGQALAGQGGKTRPDAAKPSVKPPEHFALVLAFNPVRSTPDSPEIKYYLDTRKPRKRGTIHVLLVLRG